MITAFGFAAISRADARVLILGTLPGAVSWESSEYYAQKNNAFWAIMESVIGAPVASPYAERICRLTEKGIALWDVCGAANRAGSLDSEIAVPTIVLNDFATFFASHCHIQLLAFNGRKAAALYQDLVFPTLSSSTQRIRREVLPSTSPAHANIPFERKLGQWRAVLTSSIACD